MIIEVYVTLMRIEVYVTAACVQKQYLVQTFMSYSIVASFANLICWFLANTILFKPGKIDLNW